MAIGTLMEDKEVLAMLERMITVLEDELQLDTPFMQRLREAREEGRKEGISCGREEGREEGLSLGREEGLSLGREEGLSLGLKQGFSLGREEGHEEGREEGLALGTLETLRRDILDAVMVRFSPTEQECAQVEANLARIPDETRLRALFRAALKAENLALLLQENVLQTPGSGQNEHDITEQSQ
jgi:flagellar biosynthesis/type III secretory pathway protein FliH